MAGPLQGLKILDFTTLLPGPYATMVLADLGADVLRIVSGSRPDLVEFFPPFIPGTKIAAATATLGRGKRCIALNLKDPRAIKIIHKLLARYDILIEQFRPGVMAKFGLDYESLRKINPGLIYCSLTGYGQTGPLRDRAGHDINYLSRSGVMAYSGRKETGPTLMGIQIADIASGSNNAIIGILAAAVHRQSTGQGEYVDVSMTDGMVALHAMFGAGLLVDGKELEREGNLINGGSLYDFYETKDGRYISFGGLEPQFFKALCEKINRPDWIPGGVSPKNISQVKKELREIFKTRTRDEWADFFADVDACVEPVMSISEAVDDPQMKARQMVVEVPGGDGGKVRQFAHPITFSQAAPEYRFIGVRGGAHTKEVLREMGYTDEDIESLEKTGLFS